MHVFLVIMFQSHFRHVPCAKKPCFNGAQCKNVNKDVFECTCPKGFSGPTCKNVGKYAFVSNINSQLRGGTL